MTRKDYVLIAKKFAAERPAQNPAALNEYLPRYETWYRLANAVADAFAADNHRFDRSRFLEAAGVQS